MALKYSRAQCTNKHRLLHCAVASRLLVLALTVIWRSLLSPYDTSAPINPPCLSSSINSVNPHIPPVLFPSLGLAIESSIVWDGVYFTRIAQCGYEYEQTYAFLPLLPVLILLLSKTVFAPLVPLIGYRAVLGLSGYMLNNIVFVFAALFLYQLSAVVLKNPESAFRASVLFCFNPASIFYSSLYSESLYAFFTFGGLYYFMNGNDHWATLLLSLSGCARSNGVLNAGYICYRAIQQVNASFFSRRRSFILAAKILLGGAIRCLCIFTPFMCFQAYGYFNICLGRPVDEMRPWCKARLPLLYNYIQSHYWGVGFLRYFQVKQLPNFLLATPVMSLALCSIVYYVKLWPEIFLTVGLRASSKEKELTGSSVSTVAEEWPRTTPKLDQDIDTHKLRKRGIESKNLVKQRSKSAAAVDPVVLVPFVIHLGVMATTAFFVMHVQVATRFLSASPVLYWFSTVVISKIAYTGGGGGGVIGKRWGWGHLIWAYCGAYILLGSLLFSNFYPFT